MNHPAESPEAPGNDGREPLEIELLLKEPQRITIDQHAAWQSSFAGTNRPDEIDDDLIEVDPYSDCPPSRKSDSELSRVLSILDSIEEERRGK